MVRNDTGRHPSWNAHDPIGAKRVVTSEGIRDCLSESDHGLGTQIWADPKDTFLLWKWLCGTVLAREKGKL